LRLATTTRPAALRPSKSTAMRPPRPPLSTDDTVYVTERRSPASRGLTNRTLRPPQAGSPSAPTRSRRRPRIRGWRVISPSIRDRTALPGTTGAPPPPPPPPPAAEEAASASARPLSTRDRSTYAATSRGSTANSARKDSPARSGPPLAGASAAAAAPGIVPRSAAPAPRLVDAERHLRRRRRLGRDKVVECRRHAGPVRLRPVGRSRKGRKHARVRL